MTRNKEVLFLLNNTINAGLIIRYLFNNKTMMTDNLLRSGLNNNIINMSTENGVKE